ncbi:MAG: nucleotide sugar dehydrogenase [Nanoarchaeota archaeon]|nr:nucleotide sugar dehydrogenase [Nanoarchaeota archaeon]
MNLKNELKSGKKKLGVWGLGYIGFSSITHFAKEGVTCVGHDIFETRVNDINKGKATIPNLDFWLGFDTTPLAEDGRMKATKNWEDLINKDIAVHLITIPTEMDGKPYHEILKDVVNKISKFKDVETDIPPLIIIESTLTPTAVDKIVIPLFNKNGLDVGKDILLGVAPRRDWFTSSDKSLSKLPRVVGGTTKETTQLMDDVLSIICENIIQAQDHNHSAIVKSIENAYRQMDITLANQLSAAYPDLDITSVLKMVGTKWNMGTFHPSFGTGGYCIPLAPQYVLEGAKYPEKLTLLKESLKTDFSQPSVVVESVINRGAKKVAILGLAYTGNLKVETLSPAISIAKLLKKRGIDVKVNDPYFSEEEIKQFTGCESMDFPKGLSDRDTILIVSPHMKYKHTHNDDILNNLTNTKLILDNMGVWNDMKFPENVKYYEAGSPNWLE